MLILTTLLAALVPQTLPDAGDALFHAGVRLESDGKPVQTGWFGHAAPALFDLDGDGDLDLLSFLKKAGVAVAYNTGDREAHRFEGWEPLLVDDKPVPFQYSGPVVTDLDGDEVLDLLIVREQQIQPDVWRADVFFCKNVCRRVALYCITCVPGA